MSNIKILRNISVNSTPNLLLHIEDGWNLNLLSHFQDPSYETWTKLFHLSRKCQRSPLIRKNTVDYIPQNPLLVIYLTRKISSLPRDVKHCVKDIKTSKPINFHMKHDLVVENRIKCIHGTKHLVLEIASRYYVCSKEFYVVLGKLSSTFRMQLSEWNLMEEGRLI